MTDRTKQAIASLLILFVVGTGIAVIPPMLFGREPAQTLHALPSDICLIDGKPLMPELDYIGYGSPNGLVLKYVNTGGDLVMLVEDELIAVYEGDFCRLK